MAPIVGIPLEPNALLFCTLCSHGARTKHGLQVHCSNARHPKRAAQSGYPTYAQRLVGCSTAIYVPIDIMLLECNSNLVEERALRLFKSAQQEKNYLRMPILPLTNKLSLMSFFCEQH